MSALLVQPARPGWRFWFAWMAGTIVGAAAGMVLSVPLNVILVAALGTDRAGPWSASESALIIVLKGAEGGLTGAGMGLGQWWVFRKYLKQTGGWILATGLASFLQGAFRWSLPFDTPAAQVGLTTMLSYGVLLGLCQWVVLRRRVPRAEWWIAINIAGWAATLAFIAASEFAQLSIESLPGMLAAGVSMLVPFAIAGAGMVWLLRQTAPSFALMSS